MATGKPTLAIMPQRTVKCDRCGQAALSSFDDGGRGWQESFHCPSCGEAYEADGGPLALDDPHRQFILQEEGEWALHAVSIPTVKLLKALRASLSLSLAELQQLRKRLPGEIRRGTKNEMTRLLKSVQHGAPQSNLSLRRDTKSGTA